mgnify:CR=1 FL=1
MFIDITDGTLFQVTMDIFSALSFLFFIFPFGCPVNMKIMTFAKTPYSFIGTNSILPKGNTLFKCAAESSRLYGTKAFEFDPTADWVSDLRNLWDLSMMRLEMNCLHFVAHNDFNSIVIRSICSLFKYETTANGYSNICIYTI